MKELYNWINLLLPEKPVGISLTQNSAIINLAM